MGVSDSQTSLNASTEDHHFSNFGRSPVPNKLCKISAPRHPWFWRRFLKIFTIYGHGGRLGQWNTTILTITLPPPPPLFPPPPHTHTKGLHMKLSKISSVEEKSFESVNRQTDDKQNLIKVFYIYGHGGHLGQWTATILAIFHSPAPRRLHMKSEQHWPRSFRGEVI